MKRFARLWKMGFGTWYSRMVRSGLFPGRFRLVSSADHAVRFLHAFISGDTVLFDCVGEYRERRRGYVSEYYCGSEGHRGCAPR